MTHRLLSSLPRFQAAVFGLLVALSMPPEAASQGVALGPELVVRDLDRRPSVASVSAVGVAGHRDGSFAVAWQEMVEGAGRVRLRRYDALGRPDGAFLVDADPGGAMGPHLQAISDGRGGQVVAWQKALPGHLGWGTWVRFLPPRDQTPGPRRLVVPEALDLAIVRLNAREFGVAGFALADEAGNGALLASRFDRRGGLLTGPALLTRSANPVLVANRDGGMTIVFNRAHRLGVRRFDPQVMAQRLDAAGALQGPRFAVSTLSPELHEESPDAAPLPGGGMLVVWQRSAGAGDTAVYMRRFDALGGALCPITRVAGPGSDAAPSVATDPQGRALIVWQRPIPSAGPNAIEIFGRVFDAAGKPLGATFRIDADRRGNSRPRVSAANDGTFVVAWHRRTSTTSVIGRQIFVF